MQYTERYARQIMLPEIGLSGQQALARASVLIVGAGGLGSPISLYLCTAGIGRIGLIDGDTVSESNLQRAKQTLSSRNESCRIDIYPHFLTEENAREIIEPYDIIVDGCDNYATRYLIDDWCSRLQKPYVYGSIEGFKGQVSIFNGKKGKRYVDLFPDRSTLTARPKASAGVIGPTPGVIGNIEAAEVIKLITGCGTPLYNRLFTIDLLTLESFTLDI